MIQTIAEHLQEDCHKTVESILYEKRGTNINIQDCTNVWMFRKLAEIEIRIKELESINGL